MDVGTLKSVPADTIRILVWILAFMTFGYATAEFEVTSERLGTYRPEEHIEFVLPSMYMKLHMANTSLQATQRTMPTTKMRASTILVCVARSVKLSSISIPIPA